MKALYVTTAGDEFGKATLKILKGMGCQTRVLKKGEGAPEGSVAIFTAQRRAGERRPKYLHCSSVRLMDQVPDWARSTPLWVGVLTTTDRKSRSGIGNFASALATLNIMFATWDWTSGNPVPWANVETDRSFKLGSPQLERVLAWREGPAASRLVQKARGDFTVCQRIEKQLQDQGGYFVGDPSQALQVSPDFFAVSAVELEIAQRNLDLIPMFWQQVLRVYYDAVSTRDQSLAWVAESVEGPILPKQVDWQRRVALDQPNNLPLFARADLSSIWHLVEIQERIGGLGLVESWLKAIRYVMGTQNVIGDTIGFAPAFVESVKRATGKDEPVIVLICPTGYQDEQKFLAQMLRDEGALAYVVGKETMEQELEYREGSLYLRQNGVKIDFLYRREINAASMALTEIGQNVMRATLNGNLVVEPPLNMIFDCKTPMAWVHDRRVATYFSVAVRSAITPTALLPKNIFEEFRLEGKTLSANELVGHPYVVKYGGENLKYGFGGRAVYNTKDNADGINEGLDQVALGHPWVVQPLDETNFTVRQWLRDKQQIEFRHGAGRLMFHLALNQDAKGAKIVTACAQIRPNHWKAIGCAEAVFQDMRLK